MFTALMPGSFRARSSSNNDALMSCIGRVSAAVKRFGYFAHNAELNR